MWRRGVGIAAESHGIQITLIDFTLSRLCTIDGSGAYCDLDADPELFQGPKGDCQVWYTPGYHTSTHVPWLHHLNDCRIASRFGWEPVHE